MASIKKKMSSLIPEVEGRSKEVPSYEDEQSEIIDEIVTYEVSKQDEEVRCSSSSDSHENSDEDDFNKSDSNESEVCETICEIVTYEASVDSNADDQETIYETVTYEITEKVEENGIELLYKAVDAFIGKPNEQLDTDTEVDRVDDVFESESKSDSEEGQKSEVEEDDNDEDLFKESPPEMVNPFSIVI